MFCMNFSAAKSVCGLCKRYASEIMFLVQIVAVHC